MNCRISLIVPVYNVDAYLVECLDSVANQTVTDGVECILVDDKGTDNSMTIAENWIEAYRNDESKEKNVEFVVVHHECNKGLSEARNTGISVAKGDYVYFLDSDDSIAPDCMEEMLRLVDKYPDVDMVIGNNDINDILRVPFGEFTNDRKVILRNLLYYNGRAVAAQRHMVRKALILQNGMSFCPGIIHEDNLWTFLLSRHIQSIAFSPKDQYHYRKDNPNSIMRSKKVDRETKAYKTIIEQICQNMTGFMKGTQKEYIFCNLQTAVIAHYYKDEVDRQHLIAYLLSVSSMAEQCLLKIYFNAKNRFIKRVASSLLYKCFAVADKFSR